MVMFGAGGAARAIGVETALAGLASLTVVNRSEERGRELTAMLNERTPVEAEFVLWQGDFAVPPSTDIVVNATSIGLFPDVDIVNPPSTHLIRDAAQRGCQVIDGIGMLVNQGVIGVKYWTGIDVDPAVMRAKIEEIFQVA